MEGKCSNTSLLDLLLTMHDAPLLCLSLHMTCTCVSGCFFLQLYWDLYHAPRMELFTLVVMVLLRHFICLVYHSGPGSMKDIGLYGYPLGNVTC